MVGGQNHLSTSRTLCTQAQPALSHSLIKSVTSEASADPKPELSSSLQYLVPVKDLDLCRGQRIFVKNRDYTSGRDLFLSQIGSCSKQWVNLEFIFFSNLC